MEAHARGPWKWSWDFNEQRQEADGRIFTGYSNAAMGHATCIAVSPRYSSRQQWEANARLIAAAPDLLNALSDLFVGGFIQAGTREQSLWAQELEHRLVACRAAIAKATTP
jgi:hypothetical protein